ncbi:hypothetical protein ACFSVM_25660 [Paenibacillus shunpengii]|uniref:YqbQ/XkdQ domain-containing protein n=1 Tax=Paenibacillus shunpengii TaxID=2054424 RepID=A0ABW5SVQ4_9BACL
MEIILDNRNGTLWDLSDLFESVKWRTVRRGKPGTVEITMIKPSNYKIGMINRGDVLRIKVDGVNMFYGYVFILKSSEDDTLRITAYDQIRYLLNEDTYVFTKVTAAQMIRKIAQDFKLKIGEIADTGHIIPKHLEDGKPLLDIIEKGLDKTVIANGQIFNLFDDFGSLTLRNAKTMMLDLLIGDESLMFGYDHEASIDSDTYNQIKIVQDNKKKGNRSVFMARDSSNISKWGVLQLFQEADEDATEAQIKETLNQLIKLKNREKQTLKIKALGSLSVRAGCYVQVKIGDLAINQLFLIEECEHHFDGAAHEMTIDLKVI